MTVNPPADQPAPDANEPAAYAPEVAAPEAAPVIDPVAVLEAEKADLKDKLLRTLAEMENLRRRTEKDVADAKAYAVTNFAKDMVGAADNLRRALESLPADIRVMADAAVKGMVDGVELTERDLIKTLERHGVKRLDPIGQKFDPNLHQAIFEAPDPAIAKGAVMQVVQSGFTIGGRVLRPALVGVSSGPGAASAPDAGASCH
jgi:molecular chaperone GrpE